MDWYNEYTATNKGNSPTGKAMNKELQDFIENELKYAKEGCKIEAQILEDFLLKLKESGFDFVSIFDTEEHTKIENNNVYQVLGVVFGVDASFLHLKKNGIPTWVYLVIGNDDGTTISDQSGSNEAEEINAEIDRHWEESVQKIHPEWA